MSRFRLSPRVQAVLVLALVAATGAMLGILGDRFVAQQRDARTVTTGRPGPGPMPGMPGMGAVRYGDRLALRLDLTADQRARIDSILAQDQLRIRALSRQFQPQFRAIADQTRDRVEAVLTEEQRERLREMRAERMRRIGTERPMFRDDVRPRPRRQ